MLIVGAGGFAKDLLLNFDLNKKKDQLVFYDDITKIIDSFFDQKFRVLKSLEEAKTYLNEGNKNFIIGLGGPLERHKAYNKFIEIGGVPVNSISDKACVGIHSVRIENSSIVMPFAVISNHVTVGVGSLCNGYAMIGHDSTVGDFCELCPYTAISGNCEIGSFTFVGTGAVILPNIKVGKNVIIGAGSLVTKDVPDNCMVLGTPAKIIKQLSPIDGCY